MRIELPILTPLMNVWQRWHWRVRGRYVADLSMMIRSKVIPDGKPLQSCVVEIERHSVKLPDWDGLYASAKPVLDCLVVKTKRNPHGIGLIVDDNPACIRELMVRPVKVAHLHQQKTVIIIRE